MSQLPDRIEAHCPRCNAAFVLSTGPQGKKIQCPKCRKTVAVGLTLPSPAVPPAPKALPDFKVVEDPAPAAGNELVAPTPPGETLSPAGIEADEAPRDSLLRPGHKLRWLRRDERAWIAAHLDEEQQEVLLHNLRAMGRRDIDLGTALDDQRGQRLAEFLSTIFREAGWNVRETPPSPPQTRASGLVLAAGQCPLPQTATAVYMALKAAGFSISTRLDSAFGPEQSLLIAAGGAN